MLTIKERQKRLSYLGFYTGKIDGKEGRLTKEAYKKLQDTYFIRKQDKDGIYGKNTDILLNNAYNVKLICHNFKLEEFKCHCNGKYCTGYPYIINTILLADVQIFRNKLNTPMNLTSGIRCKKWNEHVGGGVASRHLIGKAIDFYTKYSKSLEVRKGYINKWINEIKESRYGYSKGYANKKGKISYPEASHMGSAIHIDIE